MDKQKYRFDLIQIRKNFFSRGFYYHGTLHRYFGDYKTAIFTSACLHFSNPQRWNDPSTAMWFKLGTKEFERITGLSRFEQDKARNRLIAMGLLETELKGSPPIKHYRLKIEVLYQDLVAFVGINQNIIPSEFERLTCRGIGREVFSSTIKYYANLGKIEPNIGASLLLSSLLDERINAVMFKGKNPLFYHHIDKILSQTIKKKQKKAGVEKTALDIWREESQSILKDYAHQLGFWDDSSIRAFQKYHYLFEPLSVGDSIDKFRGLDYRLVIKLSELWKFVAVLPCLSNEKQIIWPENPNDRAMNLLYSAKMRYNQEEMFMSIIKHQMKNQPAQSLTEKRVTVLHYAVGAKDADPSQNQPLIAKTFIVHYFNGQWCTPNVESDVNHLSLVAKANGRRVINESSILEDAPEHVQEDYERFIIEYGKELGDIEFRQWAKANLNQIKKKAARSINLCHQLTKWMSKIHSLRQTYETALSKYKLKIDDETLSVAKARIKIKVTEDVMKTFYQQLQEAIDQKNYGNLFSQLNKDFKMGSEITEKILEQFRANTTILSFMEGDSQKPLLTGTKEVIECLAMVVFDVKKTNLQIEKSDSQINDMDLQIEEKGEKRGVQFANLTSYPHLQNQAETIVNTDEEAKNIKTSYKTIYINTTTNKDNKLSEDQNVVVGEIKNEERENQSLDWSYAEDYLGDNVRKGICKSLQSVNCEHRQVLLDELIGRVRAGTVKNPIGYLSGLINKVREGNFIPQVALQWQDMRKQRLAIATENDEKEKTLKEKAEAQLKDRLLAVGIGEDEKPWMRPGGVKELMRRLKQGSLSQTKQTPVA
jgi:hypothetical protein